MQQYTTGPLSTVAQFLLKHGIDSISVTPDSLLKTCIAINKVEAELAAAKNGKVKT